VRVAIFFTAPRSARAMSAVNQETNLTRQVPTVSGVTKWIKQAKGLPRMLEFRSGSSRRL
jgi:hypothetical protein